MLLTLASASAVGNPSPAGLGMVFRFQAPGKGPSLASPSLVLEPLLEAGCSRVVGLCGESLVLPFLLISGSNVGLQLSRETGRGWAKSWGGGVLAPGWCPGTKPVVLGLLGASAFPEPKHKLAPVSARSGLAKPTGAVQPLPRRAHVSASRRAALM